MFGVSRRMLQMGELPRDLVQASGCATGGRTRSPTSPGFRSSVRDWDGDRRDGDARPMLARCGRRLAGRRSGTVPRS